QQTKPEDFNKQSQKTSTNKARRLQQTKPEDFNKQSQKTSTNKARRLQQTKPEDFNKQSQKTSTNKAGTVHTFQFKKVNLFLDFFLKNFQFKSSSHTLLLRLLSEQAYLYPQNLRYLVVQEAC
ncbi:hypothetical protein, partial [Acinetobacter baretiae]|uniref:hypothetical protein n=1 Tax=Acinetobacter baretiae TaxID=2605383 RepID=UPI001BB3043B